MSWWNAKYKNDHGEYEITFGTKYYERAKAVEKVCKAVIDKAVKSPEDVQVVVHCKDCLYWQSGENECEKWEYCTFHNIGIGPHSFCSYGEKKEDDNAQTD